MTAPHRILLVEDDADMCLELARALGKRGFVVVTAPSATEGERHLAEDTFSAVVTDINMDGASGIELCERIVETHPQLPVIVMTAFGTLDSAVASLRAGAVDCLTKPFDQNQLARALERAIRLRELEDEVGRLRKVTGAKSFAEIVGESPAIVSLLETATTVAATAATVLVTGESGTGKELVARAIHERSARVRGPLVAINCAAMPEALLESELFGHVKGAFTDARSARRGLFLDASGGTLFLDEIGEMPLSMQVRLLRALEERCVRPVGGTQEIPFDTRIVAATNRDLESMIEEKTFREDLYYRINVVHLEVPPLRARGTDVLSIAQHFVQKYATRHNRPVRGFSKDVGGKLLAYAWPGNVRELSNTMERAIALARYEELQVDDLPAKIRDYAPTSLVVATADPGDLMTLDELERRYVQRALEVLGGNKAEVTRVLGIDRSTLYRKMDRWNLVKK
ncbi:sigma-54 dependent transcriptional regulator [soil metagenome]